MEQVFVRPVVHLARDSYKHRCVDTSELYKPNARTQHHLFFLSNPLSRILQSLREERRLHSKVLLLAPFLIFCIEGKGLFWLKAFLPQMKSRLFSLRRNDVAQDSSPGERTLGAQTGQLSPPEAEESEEDFYFPVRVSKL